MIYLWAFGACVSVALGEELFACLLVLMGILFRLEKMKY